MMVPTHPGRAARAGKKERVRAERDPQPIVFPSERDRTHLPTRKEVSHAVIDTLDHPVDHPHRHRELDLMLSEAAPLLREWPYA